MQNENIQKNQNNIHNEEQTGINETISQIIIDYLISNTITTSNAKRIYTNITSHCSTYLLEKINPFLKANFLYHDGIIPKKNILLLSTKPPMKPNTWVKIPEPQNSEFDRYDSNKAKLINIENDIRTHSNKNVQNIIFTRDSPKNSLQNNSPLNDSQKYTSKYIKKETSLNSLSESLELGEKINNVCFSNICEIKTIKKRKKKPIKIDLIREKDEDENARNKKKEKSKILEDLPAFDLPKDIYTNKYVEINSNEENNLLRLEKEKIRLQKKEQKKNELHKSKHERLKKLQKKQKIIKEFNGGSLTFDSNGKIIQIKSFPNASIINNEFLISNSKINDKKIIEKISSNKSSKKRINTSSSKKSNNDSTSKNKKNKNQKNLKIQIEYNPVCKEIKSINDFNANLMQEKQKLLESGPNLDIIVPEVGVIIKNEKKMKKVGSFEYIKKYNKPSMNEFNKLMIETTEFNNNNNLKSKFIPIDNKENINNEYNGYNKEFDDNNNPLLQDAHKLTNNKKSAENILANENEEKKNKDKCLLKNKSVNTLILKTTNFKNKKIHYYKPKNLQNNILLTKNSNAPNLITYFSCSENEENNQIKNDNNKINLQPLKNIIKKNNSNDKYAFKLTKNKNKNILPNIKISSSNKENNNNEFLRKDQNNKFNNVVIKDTKWEPVKNNYIQNKNLFKRSLKINRHSFTESSGIINQISRVNKIDMEKL